MLTKVQQLIFAGMVLLVVIGLTVAFSNLPVVTGCGYYGECGTPANR